MCGGGLSGAGSGRGARGDGRGFARRSAARRRRAHTRAVRASVFVPTGVVILIALAIVFHPRIEKWYGESGAPMLAGWLVSLKSGMNVGMDSSADGGGGRGTRSDSISSTTAAGNSNAGSHPEDSDNASDTASSAVNGIGEGDAGGSDERIKNTTDFTMFRGNPERSLSGVGTIPKRPKLLWRFKTKTKFEGEFEKRGTDQVTPESPWPGLGWTGQPVRLGDRVYFGSSDSYVYCIDMGKYGAGSGSGASDSNSAAAKSDPSLAWYYETHHSVKGSIAIFDELIYHGGRDNKIHCYDLEGRMVWETRTGNDMDSSPVVLDGKGYIGGEDHNIYCFDPQTGEIVWKYEADAGSFENSPCIAGGAVVLGTSRGWLFSVDHKTGKLNWKVSTSGDTDSTPVYVDGRIYVGCATGDENELGYFWCIDAATGETIWQKSFTRGIWATAAVNPHAGTIYIGCNNGFFYCLRMSDGEAVWKRNLGSRIWSSAVVADGRVLVPVRDGRMWCLEEGTGKPVWMFDCGGDIDATPLVAGGLIVMGNQDGWVYGIGEAGTGEDGKPEPVNKNWFITDFPAKMNTPKGVLAYPPLHRTARAVSKEPATPNYVLTIHNPAPAPKTYTDTNAGTRTNYLKPVYGAGWADAEERIGKR